MESPESERLQKPRARKRSVAKNPSRYSIRMLLPIILGICLAVNWWIDQTWGLDQQRASLPGGCVHFDSIPLSNHLSVMEHRWQQAIDTMDRLRSSRVPSPGWVAVGQSSRDMILSLSLPSNDTFFELYSVLDLCHESLSKEIDHLLAVFSVATWRVIRNTEKMSKALRRELPPPPFWIKRHRQTEIEELHQRWMTIMRDSVLAVSIANEAAIKATNQSNEVWDKISGVLKQDWEQLERKQKEDGTIRRLTRSLSPESGRDFRKNMSLWDLVKSLLWSSAQENPILLNEIRDNSTRAITDARSYYQNVTQWALKLERIWDPLGRVQEDVKLAPGFHPSWMSVCEKDTGNGSAWRTYELELADGLVRLVKRLKMYEASSVLCSLTGEEGWHPCRKSR